MGDVSPYARTAGASRPTLSAGAPPQRPHQQGDGSGRRVDRQVSGPVPAPWCKGLAVAPRAAPRLVIAGVSPPFRPLRSRAGRVIPLPRDQP